MILAMPAKVAIVVGARGRGSNMAALLSAMEARPDLAAPHVVAAPSLDAPALSAAWNAGVTTAVFPDDPGPALEGADYVCLAGYLRLVPAATVARFRDRMLNIHPALLPHHGGRGMYGMRVHEAVIASGDRRSGCTVHLVDEQYDRGRVLLQRECPVLATDTPETLAARVLALEHEAYPFALFKLIEEDGRA